jgi:uncharacterized RDD family membrane protein YckC
VCTAGVIAVVEIAGIVFGRLPSHLVPVLLIAPPALLVCYCAAFWALAGRTPGAALLGLRVSRVDGHAVSFPRALIRALIVVCFPIGFLWSIVDRRHQALHDEVGGTVVVRDLPRPAAVASPGRGTGQARLIGVDREQTAPEHPLENGHVGHPFRW